MTRNTNIVAVGLVVLAAAALLALLASPATVTRSNGGPTEPPIAETRDAATYCQPHEQLPRGTTALRISVSASEGPPTQVSIRRNGEVLTSGTRGAGWTGRVVTVPVRPLHVALNDTTVCVGVRPQNETVAVYGVPETGANVARQGGSSLGGKIAIEYLHLGTASWRSMIPAIARRFEMGSVVAETWIVALLAGLFLSSAACVAYLLLEE
jgi:hypothetical protein